MQRGLTVELKVLLKLRGALEWIDRRFFQIDVTSPQSSSMKLPTLIQLTRHLFVIEVTVSGPTA
jgi:hypothetical protein